MVRVPVLPFRHKLFVPCCRSRGGDRVPVLPFHHKVCVACCRSRGGESSGVAVPS